MLFQIPVNSLSPSYSQVIEIEDQFYNLSFSWNDRSESWYFTIADQNNMEIINGIKIVEITPLAFPSYARLPFQGIFFCESANEGSRINRNNFGTEFQFFFEDGR